MTTTQKAIGGGAVAGIVVGAAAFVIFFSVASKKSYDYYQRKNLMNGTVTNNPAYEAGNKEFVNPEFEMDTNE